MRGIGEVLEFLVVAAMHTKEVCNGSTKILLMSVVTRAHFSRPRSYFFDLSFSY